MHRWLYNVGQMFGPFFNSPNDKNLQPASQSDYLATWRLQAEPGIVYNTHTHSQSPRSNKSPTLLCVRVCPFFIVPRVPRLPLFPPNNFPPLLQSRNRSSLTLSSFSHSLSLSLSLSIYLSGRLDSHH